MNKAAALPSINRLFRSRLQIRYKNGLLCSVRFSLAQFSSVQFGSVRIVSYCIVSFAFKSSSQMPFIWQCVYESYCPSLLLPVWAVCLQGFGLPGQVSVSITHKFVVRLVTPRKRRERWRNKG